MNGLGECDCEAREDCPTEWPDESDRLPPCECACHGYGEEKISEATL